MLAADLEERLVEWSRYVRAGGRRRGHCQSIEHRWRSPQRDHWSEQAPPPRLAPIVASRAYETELVVVTLPDALRTALVLHYIARLPADILRRRLQRYGVRGHDAMRVLDEARRRVGAALMRGMQPRSQGASYPPRPSGEPIAAPALI